MDWLKRLFTSAPKGPKDVGGDRRVDDEVEDKAASIMKTTQPRPDASFATYTDYEKHIKGLVLQDLMNDSMIRDVKAKLIPVIVSQVTDAMDQKFRAFEKEMRAYIARETLNEDEESYTLVQAAMQGKLKLMKKLLVLDADVNHQTKVTLPLYISSHANYLNVL